MNEKEEPDRQKENEENMVFWKPKVERNICDHLCQMLPIRKMKWNRFLHLAIKGLGVLDSINSGLNRLEETKAY